MFDSLMKLKPYIFGKENHNRLKMLGALAIDAVTTAVNVSAPFLIADHIVPQENEDSHQKNVREAILLTSAAALLIVQTFPKLRNLLLDSVRANTQKELTMALVKKAFELEADAHLTARTGDFSQTLSKIYTTVDSYVPTLFGQIAPFTLSTVATSAALLTRFGPIALTPMGVLLVYLLVAFSLEKRALPGRQARETQGFRGYGQVLASINNYKIAHLFDMVGNEIQKVEISARQSESAVRGVHYRDDFTATILSIINTLGYTGTIGLFFAVKGSPEDTHEVINLVLYAYFAMRSNMLLDSLPPNISAFNTAAIDSQRITRITDRVPKIVDKPGAINFPFTDRVSIEFVNVSFSIGERIILDNISFTVTNNEKLAVVGPTGCGKSTIINLLLRFYNPTRGQILLNGRDITDYTIKSVRYLFSVVSQDTNLFDATVMENIKYGNITALNTDAVEAAKFAELISSNDAPILNQRVGQNTGTLSGGEKQRISIARALLKAGPIFVLDEPTSALDVKTEVEVQRTLDKLTSHTPTLLVTHRLNTIINANNIIYIENGRIIEQGNFRSLLETQGRFFHLLATQCQELGIDINSINPMPPSEEHNEVFNSFIRTRRRQLARTAGMADALNVPQPTASETEPLLRVHIQGNE